MQLFQELGVNSMLWMQMGIFLFAYLVLTNLIFKPYLRAFEERQKRTVGNEALAERLINETKQLQQDYELKARAINNQFKSIYDEARAEASGEYERVITNAREKAAHLLEASRSQVATEIATARSMLGSQVPEVTNEIVKRLLQNK